MPDFERSDPPTPAAAKPAASAKRNIRRNKNKKILKEILKDFEAFRPTPLPPHEVAATTKSPTPKKKRF